MKADDTAIAFLSKKAHKFAKRITSSEDGMLDSFDNDIHKMLEDTPAIILLGPRHFKVVEKEYLENLKFRNTVTSVVSNWAVCLEQMYEAYGSGYANIYAGIITTIQQSFTLCESEFVEKTPIYMEVDYSALDITIAYPKWYLHIVMILALSRI